MKAAAHNSLTALVAEELSRPAPPQVDIVCDEIHRRHGDALLALIFYGSCLRKQRPDEGVLDIYALVDDYRSAYRSRVLATSNAWFPPNVFYMEIEAGETVVRAKYAIISLRDFERAAQPECVHAIVWGRFSQPALVVWARDDAVRRAVAESAATAATTMMLRTAALLCDEAGRGELRSEDLWQRGFRETYKTELRTERRDTIAGIYRAAPERYDRVAALALAALEEQGELQAEAVQGAYRVRMPQQRRRALVTGWRWRRPVAKALYVVRLVKSAATFGDWLPYALWKLTRHTGVRVELTERQRRHPFLFAWPVIYRLLRARSLR